MPNTTNSIEPIIDIIIPVYNGAKTVTKTIESLFQQTYDNFNLLIIDDASKDDSVAVIEASPHFSQIKFLKNDANRGISKTYNRALGETTSEFVLFLHHDCALKSPDYLRAAITAFEDTNIGVLTGKPTISNPQALPLIEKMYTLLNFMDILPATRKDIEETTFVEFKADLIRRTTLEALGQFTEAVTHSGEDQDISAKIRDMGLKVVQHNGIEFELQYGGNQDTLLKLFKKQGALGLGQGYLSWIHREKTMQTLNANRKLRLFHRGFQIGISALLILLLFIFISRFLLPLFFWLAAGLVVFRILFYAYHTHQYGFTRHIPLFILVGIGCDFAYGFYFFYGLFLTVYRGRID